MLNPPGPPPYLQLRGLSKSFGRHPALRSISLDIFEGEFICFLGPSGCGKTTLLRIVAGLETQDTGQIIQAGRDVSQLPPSQRDFGIVFQSYALFPNLTAAENVAYGLENKRLARAEVTARVRELLALVGLSDFGDKYPAQLSGGQQQRIALIRALALSPGLLLLDEPLSALDARVRASLRSEVSRLQRRLGVTTIMVTHDQEEALTMADRIVVMNHGVIEQVGTPIEIYRRPTSPFVAHFVGEMNFVRGEMMDAPGRIQCGGIQLSVGQGANGARPGWPVTAAIRPENVRLHDVLPGKPNTFVARLDEAEFLGSFYRVRLVIEGLPATMLTVDVAATYADPVALGESAMQLVHLPAEHIQVFHD